MSFEKLKTSAQETTPDTGAVDTTPPSFDVSSLEAKKKPKGKLINPVPSFNSKPKKKNP
jgi:hypothetical protein